MSRQFSFEAENESYFDETDAAGRFQRGFSSIHGQPQQKPFAGDEVDSLDAYMLELNADLSKDAGSARKAKKPRAAWEDNQHEEDPVASYLEAYSKAAPKNFVKEVDSDGDELPGQSSGEEEHDRRKKAIEPLPSVDHSTVHYNKVEMDFYKPHPEIAALGDAERTALQAELRISTTGTNILSPVASFGHLAHVLGKPLMEAIRRHGYQKPTPIQAQALPLALSGRDVVGIAETGSGKTVAYLLPMLVHAAAQPALQKDEGPIGLVLCPTRELSIQIEQEVFKFNRQLGLRSVTLAGGLSKLEQFKEIRKGCEIVVGNPGRFIDVVKMKGCNMRRVTILVLDEADRMLHMGFEYQVRSIVQNVRPGRQTLFFSATFPPKIERLAHDLLQHPVRITIGEAGQAAANVAQTIAVVKNEDEKWQWLSKQVPAMLAKGQVLVFVKSIASAEELAQNFKDFLNKESAFLHGDLDMGERMRIISRVRKRRVDVLIATDVAARGIDIPNIASVVCYDVSRDIETHTHRIGRTGRAGASGEAFTLIVGDAENRKMAALLVEMLEQADQPVSDEHRELAIKYAPYRAAKLAGRKFEGGKKGAGPGERTSFGLGFDGMAMKLETAQDLERRLNKEADKMASANRRLMAGTRGGSGVFGASTHRGQGVAGFVSASVAAEAPPLAKGVHGADIDDSDDDLFAPGVTASFGRGARPQAPKQQRAAAKALVIDPVPKMASKTSPCNGVLSGFGAAEIAGVAALIQAASGFAAAAAAASSVPPPSGAQFPESSSTPSAEPVPQNSGFSRRQSSSRSPRSRRPRARSPRGRSPRARSPRAPSPRTRSPRTRSPRRR